MLLVALLPVLLRDPVVGLRRWLSLFTSAVYPESARFRSVTLIVESRLEVVAIILAGDAFPLLALGFMRVPKPPISPKVGVVLPFAVMGVSLPLVDPRCRAPLTLRCCFGRED